MHYAADRHASHNGLMNTVGLSNQYDTIEEFNVDSKAEYTA